MAYAYFASADLHTLNHNVNGGANDPHYSFGYTAAHELQTEANTDSDYVWQPPASSTTSYAAANTLNQYPSANGTSFGYDPKGNAVLDYDGNKNLVAFYVPGPAIDEPIVMATANGNGTYAHQYFHTNHQGSVIATSDDTGARKGGPYVSANRAASCDYLFQFTETDH
ncbi:MAG TPA: hypothetical protein VHU18_06445 [Rhizomicrobium sp.]|jgi:hypothetical protein|nr:hypothetical protein [Rhizomicrobium sp.]